MDTPITSLGETAEIAELLRLFVTDRVSEVALSAHTTGKPREEQMAQSSKRGSEKEDEEEHLDEDMGESAHRPPQVPSASSPTTPGVPPLPAATQPITNLVAPPGSAIVKEEIPIKSEGTATLPNTPTPIPLQL